MLAVNPFKDQTTWRPFVLRQFTDFRSQRDAGENPWFTALTGRNSPHPYTIGDLGSSVPSTVETRKSTRAPFVCTYLSQDPSHRDLPEFPVMQFVLTPSGESRMYTAVVIASGPDAKESKLVHSSWIDPRVDRRGGVGNWGIGSVHVLKTPTTNESGRLLLCRDESPRVGFSGVLLALDGHKASPDILRLRNEGPKGPTEHLVLPNGALLSLSQNDVHAAVYVDDGYPHILERSVAEQLLRQPLPSKVP